MNTALGLHEIDSLRIYNFGRGERHRRAGIDRCPAGSSSIAGAGLDVFEKEPLPADSPLWQMSNVIITPHVGGMAATYNDRLTDLFTENLRHYFSGQPLMNRGRP